MSRISASPTEGLSYSPLDAHYFDESKLGPEVERVFDICHGCRLCFNLCPSFPALFQFVDQKDGDVAALSDAEQRRVVDLCYQCKLCYVKCPYTPDDGHEFKLDFPRLMARAKAVRVQKEGLSFRERLLGNPDGIAIAGRVPGLAPLINWLHQLAPIRWLMDKSLGIHRHKILPKIRSETFIAWLRRSPQSCNSEGSQGKVFYFPTCYVNYNEPEIGKAAVRVLTRNELNVRADYRNCCGMPALDGGDIQRAQAQAKANIDLLLPHARDGYSILVNNPTCSMMMRKEYPNLIAGPEAKELSEAVRDPNEYLNGLRREGRFNTEFQSFPGKIRYHVPCHLRAQNIGYRSRDIMRGVGDTEVELVTECCGHDGTWAMKSEYFALSLQSGQKAFDGMAGKEITSTDCPLAAVQFEQASGKRPLHPLEILDRAYRKDGFR